MDVREVLGRRTFPVESNIRGTSRTLSPLLQIRIRIIQIAADHNTLRLHAAVTNDVLFSESVLAVKLHE